jgi:hypothetical protein
MSLTAILGVFVFWLQGYHYYILCRNETTNENLKGSYELLGNPFNKGLCDNLKRIFKRDKRNWKAEKEVELIKKELKPLGVKKSTLRRLSPNSNSQISFYKQSEVKGNKDDKFNVPS